MNKLKKTNVNEKGATCSPSSFSKCPDTGHFFNPDEFGHIVVQTITELHNVPCKLRQDGMVATVVEDGYSEWQLQTTTTGFGKCDNKAWVKVGTGESSSTSGGNLLIFDTDQERNDYLEKGEVGQIVFSNESGNYFKIDGDNSYTKAFAFLPLSGTEPNKEFDGTIHAKSFIVSNTEEESTTSLSVGSRTIESDINLYEGHSAKAVFNGEGEYIDVTSSTRRLSTITDVYEIKESLESLQYRQNYFKTTNMMSSFNTRQHFNDHSFFEEGIHGLRYESSFNSNPFSLEVSREYFQVKTAGSTLHTSNNGFSYLFTTEEQNSSIAVNPTNFLIISENPEGRAALNGNSSSTSLITEDKINNTTGGLYVEHQKPKAKKDGEAFMASEDDDIVTKKYMNENAKQDIYLDSTSSFVHRYYKENPEKYLIGGGYNIALNYNFNFTGQAKVGSDGWCNVILGTENTAKGSAANYNTLIGYDNRTEGGNNVCIGTSAKFPSNTRGCVAIGGDNNFTKHSESAAVNSGVVALGNMSTHHTGYTYTVGHNLIVRAQGEVAVGLLNTDYEPHGYTNTEKNSYDRVFSVGAGGYHSSGQIERRTAFSVHQNGAILAPITPIDIIEANPKALVTKEYLDGVAHTLLLKSPNGTIFKLGVNNEGELITEKI